MAMNSSISRGSFLFFHCIAIIFCCVLPLYRRQHLIVIKLSTSHTPHIIKILCQEWQKEEITLNRSTKHSPPLVPRALLATFPSSIDSPKQRTTKYESSCNTTNEVPRQLGWVRRPSGNSFTLYCQCLWWNNINAVFWGSKLTYNITKRVCYSVRLLLVLLLIFRDSAL